MKNQMNWPTAFFKITEAICTLMAIYFVASCVAKGPLL